MAETQTWTRRGSNPKLEQEVIDIPPTPTGEGKYGAFPVSQTITTALIIAAWYSSNIGVLLLNKCLLSFWMQIPNIPHNVAHVCLFILWFSGNFMVRDCTNAVHHLQETVS